MQLEPLKTCFDENEDTILADIAEKIRKLPSLVRSTFHKSQLC